MRPGRPRAVELLELHDTLDRLDEELRVQRIALVLTPPVSLLLAVPLLAVLWVNDAPFFLAYPFTFLIVLGVILFVLALERRRLNRERDAVRERIHEAEEWGSPSGT